MKKVIGVVRRLPGSDPVLSAVFVEPNDTSSIDSFDPVNFNVEHYLGYRADAHIAEIKRIFVEFNSAKFYKYVVEVEGEGHEVGAVIRQLSGSAPVLSAVYLSQDRTSTDSRGLRLEDYLTKHINELKKELVEFKDARFYTCFVNVGE